MKPAKYLLSTFLVSLTCTLFALLPFRGWGQTLPFYGDSSRFSPLKNGVGNELIIENSTKNIHGALVNYANGRTHFKLVIDTAFSLNDSTLRFRFTDNSTKDIVTHGSGSVTVESDPVAIAKTITITPGIGMLGSASTQALNVNPSFTTNIDTFAISTRAWRQKLADSLGAIIGTKISSAVTSVATNTATGITGGTITSTGTLAIDTFAISTRAWRQKLADSLGAIIGTKISSAVTSVATNTATGITGGTITSTGTLAIDTFAISTRAWRQKLADSLGTIISTKIFVDTAFTVPAVYTDTVKYKKNGNTYTAALIDHTDDRLFGLTVTSGGGLTLNVTSGAFRLLDGNRYTSAGGSTTLATADPSLPRKDVIYVDNTGAIGHITGTPATNPTTPQVDPVTQLLLTEVNVDAGATSISVTPTIIYDEPSTDAFTGTNTGVTVNYTNTSNVQHLTQSADVGSWTNGQTITFTKNSGTLIASDFSNISGFIKLKSALASTANIRVSFLNGTTVVSNVITLAAAQGFSKTVLTYQNIAIPISAFTFSSTTFNKIRITLAGTGGGFYLDFLQLQNGISQSTQETDPIANAKTVTITPGVGMLGSVSTQTLINNPSFTTNIDTFAISTRAWRQKLADSLGALISGAGGAQKFGKDDINAAENRSFSATGFNFTIKHPDTLTLSAASKAILEGINGLNLISNDTINEVSANYLSNKGVTANYLASTTANFGYTSGSSVTLGLTATSSALTGVGIPAFSSGTIKSLVEDQSTHAITQKTLDRNTDLTGTLTVSNGGSGLSSLTAYAILAGGTTSTGNLQQVSGVGTSGQVLTSTGAGALPTWQTPASGSSLTATQIGFGDGSNALTGSANLTYASSAVTVNNSALVSTLTPTVKLVNSTAATSGSTAQRSPALVFEGNGWKTNATAASQTTDWAIDNLPFSQGSTPGETLTFSSNINGGGWNSRATLNDAGVFAVGTTSSTSLIASSSVTTPLVLSASSSTALVLRMGGFTIQDIYGTSGNVLIQSATSGAFPTDPGTTFSIYENTAGLGSVSNTAGGTTVTGVGTLFLNWFKIGDAITITTNGTVESETITAIASNLSMTTATWTNAHTLGASYTVTGGNRFAVMGNGLVGIGTATPAAFLDIPAGTANYPQLLLHSSTLLTTPVNGAVEYDGTHMYITIGGVRKQLDN